MTDQNIEIRAPRPADEAALLALVRELNEHLEEPTEHFGAEALAEKGDGP